MNEQAPRIQIDDDWKAQAQREKEQLARKAGGASASGGSGTASAAAAPRSAATGPAASAAGASGAPELPPADFDTLVNTLASQALMYLGAMPDAQGRAYVSLEMARHHIDLLAVLEDKTRSHVTDDEKRSLASTLYELRNAYVGVAQHLREQALQGGSARSSPRM